jgi:hypothetical protein
MRSLYAANNESANQSSRIISPSMSFNYQPLNSSLNNQRVDWECKEFIVFEQLFYFKTLN